MKIPLQIFPENWKIARRVFSILLYSSLVAAVVFTVFVRSPELMDQIVCKVVYDMDTCMQNVTKRHWETSPNHPLQLTPPPAATPPPPVESSPLAQPVLAAVPADFIWENESHIHFTSDNGIHKNKMILDFEWPDFLNIGQKGNEVKIEYLIPTQKRNAFFEITLLNISLDQAKESWITYCDTETMDPAFEFSIKNETRTQLGSELDLIEAQLQQLKCSPCLGKEDPKCTQNPGSDSKCSFQDGPKVWTLVATPNRVVFSVYGDCKKIDPENNQRLEKFMKSFSVGTMDENQACPSSVQN